METLTKYRKAFCDTFQIEESILEGLSYQSIPLWDSVGHMALVAALEEAFEIMMETNDIIDLSTYEKGMTILSNSYGIQF